MISALNETNESCCVTQCCDVLKLFNQFLMNWVRNSMGSGKMMVEFFSDAMVLSVCTQRNRRINKKNPICLAIQMFRKRPTRSANSI